MTDNRLQPDQAPVPCGYCNGSGKVDQVVTTEPSAGPVIHSENCTNCRGTGRL